MSQNLKKLGDAELEIMQAIWSEPQALTSVAVLKKLEGQRSWKLSTLMTSLSRLEDKGYIRRDKVNGANLYTAVIAENEYKARASESFLKKLYNSSAQSLVATLYDNKMLSGDDIRKLREYLDELESEQK